MPTTVTETDYTNTTTFGALPNGAIFKTSAAGQQMMKVPSSAGNIVNLTNAAVGTLADSTVVIVLQSVTITTNP
jgi:hypothetical protein